MKIKILSIFLFTCGLCLAQNKTTSIGGKVQDDKGRPVANATIQVLGLSKDEAGQSFVKELDKVTTGAKGGWTSQKVPESFENLIFSIKHENFFPEEYE